MRVIIGIAAGIGLTLGWIHYWRRILWYLFSLGD